MEGLEYLNATEAKINIYAGGAILKYENLSRPTQTRIKTAEVITYVNEKGQSVLTTTFPTLVSELKFIPNRLKLSRPANEGAMLHTEVSKNRPGGGNSKQKRLWVRALGRNGLKPGGRYKTPIGGSGTGGKGLWYVWIGSQLGNAILMG